MCTQIDANIGRLVETLEKLGLTDDTMIDFDINSETCPSCGFPKMDSTGKDMTGRPLCFYCYFRGRHMMTKVLMLMVLDE